MRFSPRLLASAAEFRKPSIHFLGRRKWPSVPEPPHPHPAAPKEYQTSSFFTDFHKKSTSSPQPSQPPSQKASPSNSGAYTEFWQAPSRIWQPRVHKLSEEEIDAIQSGGATLF